jgi:hypothetical protein
MQNHSRIVVELGQLQNLTLGAERVLDVFLDEQLHDVVVVDTKQRCLEVQHSLGGDDAGARDEAATLREPGASLKQTV